MHALSRFELVQRPGKETCQFWQILTPTSFPAIRYREVLDRAGHFLNQMTSHRLPNYLLSYRKRLGLSQADVAYLINASGGEKVCRDEQFSREPDLRAALAYEAVYKAVASELFGGLYAEIEKEVAARAKLLMKRTCDPSSNRRNARRCAILAGIAGLESALEA